MSGLDVNPDVQYHSRPFEEQEQELKTEVDTEDQKPPRSRKQTKQSLKDIRITEKTNMTSLAAHIVPQLSEMQKNFLGLLFFNELSQTIVDEIVAQQLSIMSGSKIRDLLSVLDPQTKESASRQLVEEAPAVTRASLVVESLAAMDPQQLAETVLNISGYQSLEVVQWMSELGGERFRRSLIQSLIQPDSNTTMKIGEGQLGSDGADEIFDSCEEGS